MSRFSSDAKYSACVSTVAFRAVPKPSWAPLWTSAVWIGFNAMDGGDERTVACG